MFYSSSVRKLEGLQLAETDCSLFILPFYLQDAAIKAAVVMGGMAGYSWS